MTKFDTPSLPMQYVPRKKFFQELDEAPCPHVYVCAPAGYGKTVALALWLRPQRNKYAWVALDASVDTPFRFFRLLLEAICHAQMANKRIRRALEKLSQSAYPLEVLLDALQMLLDNDKRYLLVLDDWHCIRDASLQASLAQILRHMPVNWRVIIASRKMPDPALAELVFKERLAVLNMDDLKFSLPEIQQLYQKNGQSLQEREAARMLQETDGWAIAVSARRLGQAQFGKGGEDLFGSYLDSEIWSSLHPKDHDLLVKTSVAGRLSVPLCACITGFEDCGERLRALHSAGVFLTANADGSYSVHHLFREYLSARFQKLPIAEQTGVLEEAGHWYFEQGDYYAAADCFVQTKNAREIARCLQETSRYTISNDIEWRMEAFRKTVLERLDAAFIESDLVLTRQNTWFHFLGGNAAEYEAGMDRIYQLLPGVQDPRVWETTMFLASLDYRIPAFALMQKLKESLAAGPKQAPDKPVYSATITLNLPHAHRSMRDYAECANDLDAFLALSRQSIGRMIGEEYLAVEDCVYAGIYFEQNKLDQAHEAALRAVKRCGTGHSPEICFCAHMILIDILHAQGDHGEARREETLVEEMIESRGALYLEPNYRAYLYSKHIGAGNAPMAQEWLARFGTDRKGELPFYQMYRHFTTARAYIATGQWEPAILFLKKLICLAQAYRRPLDCIQGNILLAIAHWQHHERKPALGAMAQALCAAQGGGFIQPFLRENRAAVGLVLQTMQRSVRSSHVTGVELDFLRSILFHMPGGSIGDELPAGRVHLSRRQREVLALMAQNLSYEDIAKQLDIRYSTVKTHVQKLFQKLNVNTFEGAVAAAPDKIPSSAQP